jgi:DNA-directed RNA polymerase subunit RPC12/RpoP
MVYLNDAEAKEVQCPSCGSGAIYKYGKIRSGKQRFYCIMCGRQFTEHDRRSILDNRPVCPECGNIMHIYKRGADFIRFRCSNFLNCKTYSKILIRKELANELLSA